MKKWFALTCPVCGFRYPLKKFGPMMNPIQYPLQLVTGGGRAKGFRVLEYIPWSTLPSLARTEAWNSLLYLYNRLGAAYDLFYETLGFLSPRMKTLLESSYAVAYQPNPLENYSNVYDATNTAQDVADAYADDDISGAYSTSLFLASTWV